MVGNATSNSKEATANSPPGPQQINLPAALLPGWMLGESTAALAQKASGPLQAACEASRSSLQPGTSPLPFAEHMSRILRVAKLAGKVAGSRALAAGAWANFGMGRWPMYTSAAERGLVRHSSGCDLSV